MGDEGGKEKEIELVKIERLNLGKSVRRRFGISDYKS